MKMRNDENSDITLFDNDTQKDIKIYSVGSCDYQTKSGKYNVVLEYRKNKKYITNDLENVTANQCIIKGLIDAVSLIKEPCKIVAITSTEIGVSSARKGKGVNKDLVLELLKTVSQKKSTIEFDARLGEGEKIKKIIFSKK